MVVDCAKASFAALGEVFAGESLTSQLSTFRDAIDGIADECESALADH